VMLPKAESAAQVVATRREMPDGRVLALIESARGVVSAQQIAGAAGVVRVVFGTLDYALDLDLDAAESPEGLAHAASVLAIASRVAGLPAPVAGVTPQLDDEQRLLADLAWSRRHGFGAKLCIHPRQVASIHAALAPSEQAIEWARRVLSAEAASPGAAQLDGRMIDRPVVLQAQRTLQRAGTELHRT
jgi:citrate lyase subunit beta / citryl-CoA lyase